MEGLWGVVIIAGPLLLLAAFIFGWLRNRQMSESEKLRSDRATRELREEIAETPEKRVDL
ncbi:MAG: hypothetical protein KJO02_00660 [Erythrobacter sp.]|nr:hypothetical protein [Erythrobacter sp.]NNC53340.1 hypothetical protein [Erythrobacter sp.]